ncbi:MAG: hypothetical protein U5L96_20285 [Owenweeksia sp.]|nr:hypothetical protein [Owenweeksia sp.]
MDSTKGNMSGEFDVSGPTDNPSYEGSISFNQIGLTPTALGTYFQLNNEKLRLDNEGVYF